MRIVSGLCPDCLYLLADFLSVPPYPGCLAHRIRQPAEDNEGKSIVRREVRYLGGGGALEFLPGYFYLFYKGN